MIILFDIDGVLIESRAYHAALRETVAYFCRRLGLGEMSLEAADIDVFESQSVTVEWESSAICLAGLLLERAHAAPLPDPLPELPPGGGPGFWQAVDRLAVSAPFPRPDFSGWARRVGQATAAGEIPARAALRLFRADLEQLPLSPEHRRFCAGMLERLLARAYDIDRAPAMQVFQNYALGHAQYAESYALVPQVQGEPLLEQLDRPRLSAEARDRILHARLAGRAWPVIYTARPSLAPLEAAGRLRGYTPEAESARRMVGLDPVPVMGFGKVDWMARQVGLRGADLVKPSPVQSMAALALARTGQEVEALKAALAVARGVHLRYPLTACAGQTAHVLEDSPSSLQAVARGVEQLNRQGLNLQLVRHGIAPEGSPKHAALARVADQVHADVNLAVETILKDGAG